MRANALKDWWEDTGGDVLISQPLETSSKLYKLGSNFYNFIQRHYPGFHYFYFNFLEIANFHRKKKRILGAHHWLKEIINFKPKIVLSVHAHLNHGYFELLRENLPYPFKFIVYCGELADGAGYSRHWINSDTDYFFGPFRETCNAAIKRNMPQDKTFVVGPLLRKAFYAKSYLPHKDKIFKKYNINLNIPFVLLGTGANGVNRHLEILSSLKKNPPKFQVIALCGKNWKVFKKIKAFREKLGFNVVPLMTINDQEMAIFLRETKCFFSRPGAGSTTEAIVCGAPVIFDISRGIMPQEQNNLNFWRLHANQTICTNKPRMLSKLIGSSAPRVNFEIDSSPKVLLDKLDQICLEND